MAIYFERFGCVICKKKGGQHDGIGLCASCRSTIYGRRRRILSEPRPVEVVYRKGAAGKGLPGPRCEEINEILGCESLKPERNIHIVAGRIG